MTNHTMTIPALNEDAIAWVTDIFNASNDGYENLQASLSTLDQSAQSITLSIEKRLRKSTTCIPQIQAKLQSLERFIDPIHNEMKQMSLFPSSETQMSSQSLSKHTPSLAIVYRSLERMKRCKLLLEHGLQWEENVRNFTTFINKLSLDSDEKEAQSLAVFLDQMNESLSILANVPHFHERTTKLRAVHIQLQEILRPLLRKYLEGPNVPESFHNIFQAIGMEETFWEMYCTSRVKTYHRTWKTIRSEDCAGNETYRKVLVMMQEERHYVCKIASEKEENVLQTMLRLALAPYHTSFIAEMQQNFSIDQFVSRFQNACNFLREIAPQICAKDESKGVRQMIPIVFDLFQPFYTNFVRFGVKEWNEKVVHRLETTYAIDEQFIQVFTDTLEYWSDRSYALSHGLLYPQLLQLIDQCIVDISRTLKDSKRVSCESLKGTDCENDDIFDTYKSLNTFDWEALHDALKQLTNCGRVELALEILERKISIQMQQRLRLWLASAHREDMEMLAAQYLLKDEDRSVEYMQRFLAMLETRHTNNESVLETGMEAMHIVTMQVQSSVFNNVFNVIEKYLEQIPSLEIWSAQAESGAKDLPSLSTLPQEYITSIADLLLSLIPQLEPFAQSCPMEECALASCDAPNLCYAQWESVQELYELSTAQILSCRDIFPILSQWDGRNATSAMEFVDVWVAIIAHSALARFLKSVSEISTLSDVGVKQLRVDIGYFHNVLNALGAEDNFILSKLQRFLNNVHETESSTDSVPDTIHEKIKEKLIQKLK